MLMTVERRLEEERLGVLVPFDIADHALLIIRIGDSELAHVRQQPPPALTLDADGFIFFQREVDPQVFEIGIEVFDPKEQRALSRFVGSHLPLLLAQPLRSASRHFLQCLRVGERVTVRILKHLCIGDHVRIPDAGHQ